MHDPDADSANCLSVTGVVEEAAGELLMMVMDCFYLFCLQNEYERWLFRSGLHKNKDGAMAPQEIYLC
jgi:hypothetical protein